MHKQLGVFDRLYRNDPGRLLKFNTAKIYIDGILDLGTAALVEPYDKPVDPEYPSGFRYFKPEQLQAYVSKLHAIGYRMHFHVIGDAAARTALDVVEAIDAEPAAIAARRHRTTHNYLVHPDDLGRFAKLGVIADFQVGPESTSTGYQDYLTELIGDRAYDLIPVAAVLKTGADVSLSSDWDADPLSPFGTIQRAVTRKTNAVSDVEQAIALVTIDAAYALGHDDVTGSIEVGKYADYTVIDQHLLDIATDEIERTHVLLTALAGRETYRARGFAG